MKTESKGRERTTKTGAMPTATAPADGGLLSMQQAIGLLKTSRPTFYRWLREGRFAGVKAGRQWRFRREDLDRFLGGQPPRVDLPVDIRPLGRALAALLPAARRQRVEGTGVATVTELVRLTLAVAAEQRASDIHIAPEQPVDGRRQVRLRMRIDGSLRTVAELDGRLLAPVVEQWKIMAACDPRERERPQDGRILLAADELGATAPLDVRVCFLPTVLGESLTARLISRADVMLDLARMDYAPHDHERLVRALDAPWGMVLATGPVGSGKTTTLYGCLERLARREQKIVSIEDPVEYVLPGVQQTQVNARLGLTFAPAMRAALRSDPDVIMVGEIRDRETLAVCCQAALCGHVVLSTLHTDSAAQALARMVDIGVDPFVVGDATKLVLAQRLVRRLCPACAVPDALSTAQMESARRLAPFDPPAWEQAQQVHRAVGCDKCARTGFRGRTVIAETLVMDREIGQALRHGASAEELARLSAAHGLTSMAADGFRKAAAGITTFDEVIRTLGGRL